jgi:hypothetical protein
LLLDSWQGYGKAGATLRAPAWIASERIAAASASLRARVREKGSEGGAQKLFDWIEFERRRDRPL